MIDLLCEQQRVYDTLQRFGVRCFLRMDKSDDALWVTDFPRWCADAQRAQCALEEIDVQWKMANGLWKLDWTEKTWTDKLAALPELPVRMPRDERYHPAYALCRFWLLHSGEISAESLHSARRLLKLAAGPEDELLAAVPVMHMEAAAGLRNGRLTAFGTRRILAAWINKKENES